MTRRRFFVSGSHTEGDSVQFNGSDAHRIRDVLRLRSGDAIEVIDSAANTYRAIVECSARAVSATLAERLAQTQQKSAGIDVAQGLPKGQKMDFVVEKLTELGVDAIIPLESERAVVTSVGTEKIDRWRRLAKNAAQQCGRSDIPAIEKPRSFAALLQTFSQYDAVLFPWELASGPPARETLPALIRSAKRILVVIGPEGGFSHREAEEAAAAGAHLISLGPRILRTETAALVMVSILSYAIGV